MGQSGAGKGLLAQEVAKQLGWKFINADVLGCVGHIGKSFTEVFGANVLDKFAKTLTEILQYQVTFENVVVTTDENIVCDAEARKILKEEFTANVEVSTSTQVERAHQSNKPLLPVDYAAALDKYHEELDHLFAEVASFTLNSDKGDVEREAKSIIDAYNKLS